ncbi:hypothetical protein BU116_10805 [Staphylococcus xylosus]|uniref:gluconate:H+ symporter n=1 Tax=Staphylococcus xylosus TaxID=1288 RepID=UPI000E67E41F|nr:gluconate:H+ symporter [Staphylococcus xylosus]RIM76422.1 hypothetical protein BU116_10805 [Staphylococcus xylosus]
MPFTSKLLGSFLPPHPGPIAVSAEYGANIGLVLVYGIIVAIPTVIISGIYYPKIAQKFIPSAFGKVQLERSTFATTENIKFKKLPTFRLSLFTALFPVFLMTIGAVLDILQKQMGFVDNIIISILKLITNSSTAMMLSLVLVLYTMGIKQSISRKQITQSCTNAINAMGMLLLVIGGGGALKQVIIDGGVGDYIATLFDGSNLSPILFAWIVAAILRLALGSGTVATLTTAGLVIPSLTGVPDVNLELVALATGAGSAVASHVNDAGFWIVKESLGMTLKEAFGTYTVLSSIFGICGLIFIMILDMFV